jgi:hypothetical protein
MFMRISAGKLTRLKAAFVAIFVWGLNQAGVETEIATRKKKKRGRREKERSRGRMMKVKEERRCA